MSARHAVFTEDPAAVLARHRALLAKPWQRRSIQTGAPLAVFGLALFSIWWLGLSFEEIGPGLVHLGKLVALMVPPSTGGHLQLFLRSMGETLAIAFLGTLIAAVVAMPLGLLAAKNITPYPLCRFPIR
jgi:phosphonate transport system permease protein